MTKRRLFGDLKQGDKFSISPCGGLRIKIAPVIPCDESGNSSTKGASFNVINLEDGSPCTFWNTDTVWAEEK